ncbi:uncharacterized protein LOC134844703 [Symsagittifera roscoffensis]|uniref:uncharacterized protein LOC134844703 n=1 Tax=Symsagittifera roscoffensis TaxID=84072 RepID=UPI00307C31D1
MSHNHAHNHAHNTSDHVSYEEMLKTNYELTEEKTKQLVDSIGIKPDWHILDAGAGIGIMSQLFLDKIKDGPGTLTLMEPSPSFETHLEQLVLANKKKVIFKKTQIEMRDYPCKKSDSGYDLVFIRLVLHHCRADYAIGCLLSVLKPGGMFVVQEFVHGTAAFWAQKTVCTALHQLELQSIGEIRTHALCGDHANYIPPAMYKNLISQSCEVLHFDKFIPEGHPADTLGKNVFTMMTKHCRNEETKNKAQKEYEDICVEKHSVVYSRVHINIIAKKN